MRKKIEACFKRLQTLSIQPTRDNMEKLLQTLYDLEEVYNKLKEDEGDGRTAADPERRDDH